MKAEEHGKTADQILGNYPFVPDNKNKNLFVRIDHARSAMQEYSDQENAQLMERVKELEEALRNLYRHAPDEDFFLDSEFKDVIEKARKVLNKEQL
jgi:hypothetical protein